MKKPFVLKRRFGLIETCQNLPKLTGKFDKTNRVNLQKRSREHVRSNSVPGSPSQRAFSSDGKILAVQQALLLRTYSKKDHEANPKLRI